MRITFEDTSAAIVEHLNPPAALRRLVRAATNDLYYGPTYLTAEGEPCSMFDGYHHTFDFTRAVKIIRNWLDNRDEFYIEVWSGCAVDAIEDEQWDDYDDYIAVDRSTMAKALCGSKLSTYVS